MIISIASGKGGTGKTMISSNLALTLKSAKILDCDVEEPNLHLFLNHKIIGTMDVNILVPEVDICRCIKCGKCETICQFNAIVIINEQVKIFPNICHSCGGCFLACPENALMKVAYKIGEIYDAECINRNSFSYGYLSVTKPMAVPIIREVKRKIKKENEIVIIDSPPGTSCPMVATVKNSDYCVLVTEPTPYGLNDLKLAVEVLKVMKIPFGVVINRSDIGSLCVEKYCNDNCISILAKIPYSEEIIYAYSEGKCIVECDDKYKKFFEKLYKNIIEDEKKWNKF